MKVFKILLHILKWTLAILIFLFSIATLVGRSYVQTGFLWMLVAVLAWWPSIFSRRWSTNISALSRLALIVILLFISFFVIKPEPKSSIYLSEQMESELMEIYDENITNWPKDTEDIYLQSEFGKVHVLACGSEDKPPLVMIHAASMGAHSWAENLEPLLDHYRIYSIDNIGEGNKSKLADPLVYPEDQQMIADHMAFILNELGVERSPIFGASNGGFVAMSYTLYYPERVESLALFGPMGLTQLSGKSIMMLSIASMYPLQCIRDRVSRWALGENQNVIDKYGDWFNCILKGTIPSLGNPVPLTTEQKSEMDLPVLLLLGTNDPIVGDAEFARITAEEFPNIRIEVLKSGHLMTVEHANYVNSIVKEFLGL